MVPSEKRSEKSRKSDSKNDDTLGTPGWVSRGGMNSTTVSGGTIWIPVIELVRRLWRRLQTR